MNVHPVLLFGDDRSPEADVAWLWINSQRWPGWAVEVLEARPPESGAPIGHEHVAPRRWTPDVARPVFPNAQLGDIEYLITESDPRVALSRTAELLVIGPRGAGFLKSLHLGSTAEWLLVHPPAPLVIGRHGRPVRRILVGADASVHAERAVTSLVAMPWITDTVVTVAAVDDGRIDPEPAMARAVDRLAAAGAQVRARLLSGRPSHELLNEIDRDNVDLVALGTRGLTGLNRLRLGSTAGAVARSAPCSVLLACDDEFANA